jgi:hypothetical protein
MTCDFGIQLAPTSFVWIFTDYTYKTKFSAHLIIHHVMPDGSILVVPSHNHTEQHAGSRYFLDRLIQELPHITTVQDYSIYSRDREFRLPYACKPNGGHVPNWTPGTLLFADSYRPFADALVTYFGGRQLHVLPLPTVQPARPICCKGSAATGDRTNGTNIRASPPSHLTCSDVEQLAMDCLYQHVHPTVYMCIKGDIYDRRAAPRFSYTDRSEVCWCGHTHERQHFAAWVAGNEVYAHCFSAKASADRRTIRVGDLKDDFAEAGDQEVWMKLLTYEPGPYTLKKPVVGPTNEHKEEPVLEKGQRSIKQYAVAHSEVTPLRQPRGHKHKKKPYMNKKPRWSQSSILKYVQRTSRQATRAHRAGHKRTEEPGTSHSVPSEFWQFFIQALWRASNLTVSIL